MAPAHSPARSLRARSSCSTDRGSDLPTLAGASIGGDGKVATNAGGTQVLFDGVPAPILYASSGQVAAVVPYAVDGKPGTQVQVRNGSLTSDTVAMPVFPAAPSIFSVDLSGTGQAAVLNQDGLTVNSAKTSGGQRQLHFDLCDRRRPDRPGRNRRQDRHRWESAEAGSSGSGMGGWQAGRSAIRGRGAQCGGGIVPGQRAHPAERLERRCPHRNPGRQRPHPSRHDSRSQVGQTIAFSGLSCLPNHSHKALPECHRLRLRVLVQPHRRHFAFAHRVGVRPMLFVAPARPLHRAPLAPHRHHLFARRPSPRPLRTSRSVTAHPTSPRKTAARRRCPSRRPAKGESPPFPTPRHRPSRLARPPGLRGRTPCRIPVTISLLIARFSLQDIRTLHYAWIQRYRIFMPNQPFRDAERKQLSLLAAVEKKTLIWIAQRMPAWVNSDHLTLLGFVAYGSSPACATGRPVGTAVRSSG